MTDQKDVKIENLYKKVKFYQTQSGSESKYSIPQEFEKLVRIDDDEALQQSIS
jgi:hypothetical protein